MHFHEQFSGLEERILLADFTALTDSCWAVEGIDGLGRKNVKADLPLGDAEHSSSLTLAEQAFAK